MEPTTLPPAFDHEYYRQRYSDVVPMKNDLLLQHYQEFGIDEGRASSPAAWRKILVDLVQQEASILEVGPFATPAVEGEHVRYIDAFDTDELIRRCSWHGLDTSRVPHIDYVSPGGSFDMVDRKFGAVFGSHSIEHQPDLVRHLRNVSSVLEPGGRYYIVSPDKRYCFDHFRNTSTIADVITAYLTNLGRHQPRTLISHALEVTHNDPARHWKNDHGAPSYQRSNGPTLDILRQQIESMEYIDSHAWQFTPNAFFEIVSALNRMALTDLVPERVYHTPRDMFEFTAVLRKGKNDDDIAFISRQEKSCEVTRSEPMPKGAAVERLMFSRMSRLRMMFRKIA
jgi:SAM-dependent methyltransferase